MDYDVKQRCSKKLKKLIFIYDFKYLKLNIS